MSVSDGSTSQSRFVLPKERRPDFVLGIAAVILGLYVGYEATTYHDGSTYDSLGPSLMPLVIALGLLVSGSVIAKSALGRKADFGLSEPIDWTPVAWLASAIALPILFLTSVGWVPVIAIVFALSARAFGSKRFLLDTGIGLVFSAVTFVVFNYALGLSLPAGMLLARVLG